MFSNRGLDFPPFPAAPPSASDRANARPSPTKNILHKITDPVLPNDRSDVGEDDKVQGR